jgi:hypothetical protein
MLSAFSQSLYFDIGLGIGGGITTIDNVDVMGLIYDVDDVSTNLGLKIGYGPIDKLSIPVYFACEFSGVGHRLYDSYNFIQYNSYLVGPSIVFYPVSLIQLSVTLGYSFIYNDTDLPIIMDSSNGGIAWDISGGLDLGPRNHGILIGLKYFGSLVELKTLKTMQQTSYFGVFVKYAYRQKQRV